MQSKSTQSEQAAHPKAIVAVPLAHKDANPVIDIAQLKSQLLFQSTSSSDPCATVILQPYNENDDTSPKLSHRRLATVVFTAVVKIGRPRMNVVLRRPSSMSVSSTSTGPQGQPFPPDPAPIWLPLTDVEDRNLSLSSANPETMYETVAVGGTFDRLHAGHRLLLTIAAWCTQCHLRIGITSPNLLAHKRHTELIAPIEERMAAAEAYARLVNPALAKVTTTVLTDAAGPSATDPDIKALVVSAETATSAHGINDLRKATGLSPFTVVVVDVLHGMGEKLSSTALREEDSNFLQNTNVDS